MVVTPIKSRINYKDFVIITALAATLYGCQKPELEPSKNAGTIKIKIQTQPIAAVAEPNKRLPENIFDNRLEERDLTESQFTSLYGEAVHKALPQTTIITEGPLKLSVKVEKTDQRACKVDLHKLWARCKDRPGHREELVRPNVATIYSMVTFVNQPLAGEDPIDKIVPLVRGQNFFQALKTSNKAFPVDQLFYEKLNSELFIVYAVDDPQAPKPLNTDFVEHYAKTKREEVKGLALRNLERLMAKVVTIRADGPIYGVTAGGVYEPSLILLDRFVRDFGSKVKGRLVISLPTRETLYFCGDETPGALKKLRDVTDQVVVTSKVPISEKLFVYDQGQWKVFQAFDN